MWQTAHFLEGTKLEESQDVISLHCLFPSDDLGLEGLVELILICWSFASSLTDQLTIL